MSKPKPDHEISKGIVVNPHRCGGKPTIEGTRITAEMVAELAKDWDAFHLIDEYPSLTYADISNAKYWAKRETSGIFWPE